MRPDSSVLHIVEPTLVGKAGHCYSFLDSLFRAMEKTRPIFPVTVWAGKRAHLPESKERDIDIIPYFNRRFRKVQALLLYRKLLEKPCRIFVQTAGRTDLLLLYMAHRSAIPRDTVYLYFHWLKLNKKKEDFIRGMAARQPNLVIVTPLKSVADQLLELGFHDVKQVPYPITPHDKDVRLSEFRHILYAGAARRDKGFDKVVDLVEHMAAEKLDVPIVIQTSADHYNRYDKHVRSDAARLERTAYPMMDTRPLTLDEGDYGELFRGGICLQPYDSNDFADRISGVTLDAFSQGCPIVATDGTWMARMAKRFGAGIAVEDNCPESLLNAVDIIRKDYSTYRDRAVEAGRLLYDEHSAEHLANLLTEGL